MAKAPGDARMAPPRVRGAVCGINDLPDDVLLRAICLLDARQLVQTCVLSWRWRDLWRSVPRINASRHEFEGMADTDEECDALFKKFVNRFMMLRNPVALDEFRLWYHVPDESQRDPRADSKDANLWIRHALQCNARSVKVSVWVNELHLNPAVFASKCFLTNLQLSCVFVIPGFFRSLQKGCTVLERLILRDCTIADPEISSQTLKVLTIDAGCHCTFDGQASISIPSLIDISFFAYASLPLLNNMESLLTAEFGTGDDEGDDICEFLRGLSGVTDLEFYYRGTTMNLQWCPKFNNLTTLTLGKWCLHPDFNPLILFLQNSPNLVELTLYLRKLSPSTNQRIIGEPKERLFTCEHLEIVEIVCPDMDGSEDDPVVDSLEKLLNANGVPSDIIDKI
ncbi:hypothetical protein ACP70R_019747 [Stipagrostis hirtigluma subsp. patula]